MEIFFPGSAESWGQRSGWWLHSGRAQPRLWILLLIEIDPVCVSRIQSSASIIPCNHLRLQLDGGFHSDNKRQYLLDSIDLHFFLTSCLLYSVNLSYFEFSRILYNPLLFYLFKSCELHPCCRPVSQMDGVCEQRQWSKWKLIIGCLASGGAGADTCKPLDAEIARPDHSWRLWLPFISPHRSPGECGRRDPGDPVLETRKRENKICTPHRKHNQLVFWAPSSRFLWHLCCKIYLEG